MKKTLTITLAILGALFPTLNSLHANEGHHQSNSNHQNETMEMNNSSETHDHHHKTVMIQEGQPVPSVDVIVHQDAMRGWNLEIKLNNFAFTPESVNQANQPNEGHAHLYINGEKITRIYSNWYHLPELPSGSNQVKISLNTNSHESLMYQNQMIEDIEVIEVP